MGIVADRARQDAAPLRQRRSFLWDCWTVLTSSHVATALGVATSYVVRHWLAPRLVGIWSAVRLVLDYASFADLGATRAAAVEIAVATGAGDKRRALRAVSTTMAIELAAAGAVSILLLAAAATAYARDRLDWAVAFLATVLLLFVRRALTLALTTLRSSLDFTVPAWSRIVGAVLELVLLAGGAVLFGLPGLLAGAVCAEAANLVFVTRTRALHLWPAWHHATATRLIRSGAPLAAGALALMAVRSIERAIVIIFARDGELMLGLYTTALLISTRVFDQANLVSNVLFPRMGIRLAETRDPDEVLLLGFQGATLLSLMLVPVAVGAALVGVPLTAWLLPRYRPGLTAVWGALVASVALGGSLPLRHALVTLGYSWRMCAAYAAAALCAAVATLTCVRYAPGNLPLVAWAAAAGSLSASLLLSIVSTCGRRRLIARLWLYWAAACYPTALLASMQWLASSGWFWLTACGLVGATPPAIIVWYAWQRRRQSQPPTSSGSSDAAAVDPVENHTSGEQIE